MSGFSFDDSSMNWVVWNYYQSIQIHDEQKIVYEELTGEINLWIAVIARALIDYKTSWSSEVRVKALAWLKSLDCQHICEISFLNYDLLLEILILPETQLCNLLQY